MEYEAVKTELVEIAKIVQQFPEEVRGKVFDLLIERLLGSDIPPTSSRIQPKQAVHEDDKSETTPRTKSSGKRTGSKESYKNNREINLRGDKSMPSFKDFVDEKQPGSSKEFNAVVLYYLKKLASIEKVTLDHAYTCYSDVKRRPPEHFKQSFIDTKNKEGWVEFDTGGKSGDSAPGSRVRRA